MPHRLTAAIAACVIAMPAISAEVCAKGEKRLRANEECIPVTLFNYLYCLQESGGGKVEVIRKSGEEKSSGLEIQLSGKGSGVVIKGEGGGAVKMSDASKAAKELQEMLDPTLAANCKHFANEAQAAGGASSRSTTPATVPDKTAPAKPQKSTATPPSKQPTLETRDALMARLKSISRQVGWRVSSSTCSLREGSEFGRKVFASGSIRGEVTLPTNFTGYVFLNHQTDANRATEFTCDGGRVGGNWCHFENAVGKEHSITFEYRVPTNCGDVTNACDIRLAVSAVPVTRDVVLGPFLLSEGWPSTNANVKCPSS